MNTIAPSPLRTRYEADGFLIHPQSVVAPELLASAIAGLEAVRDGHYDTGQPHEASPWKPGGDPNTLVKIEQPQMSSRALQEVLRSPALAALAAEITGARQVQVWWVQGLIKPSVAPGQTSATNVGWHQDKQYWKEWSEDSELFTAWLALSDVTAEAGPMVFARGSQHWGLQDGGNFFSQNQQEILAAVQVPQGEKWEEVPAILGPGGVSFHHRLTFHGSNQNTSGGPRRSLAIHMRTDKSVSTPGSWSGRYLDNPDICPVIVGG